MIIMDSSFNKQHISNMIICQISEFELVITLHVQTKVLFRIFLNGSHSDLDF